MTHNPLTELELIAQALARLSEGMADDLGDLPYSRISSYINLISDLADDIFHEIKRLREGPGQSPAPDFAAEQETAREQLEREPEVEPVPIDEQADASEFAEPVELVHDVSDLLTGPERMVQAAPDEAPALNPDMQDEREQPVTDVAALIASGEHSYDEVAAIAYPEPQWNEPQPTEGYAPVTNPAADEAAKAHDWYDPKAVAERQKFNPFSIFRREDA